MQHPFLSKAKPDEPEILEDGPIEELEAIVGGIYAHLKAIRHEMNSDHNASVTASVKRHYNVLSIHEMAHRILFGEAPANNNNKNISEEVGCERLSSLAHQLHMDLMLATEVAKSALNKLRLNDEAASQDCTAPTPKAVHYQ